VDSIRIQTIGKAWRKYKPAKLIRQNIFVLTIIAVNMIYVSNVGSVTDANSFVATNFFSTAITGYWKGSSISSPLTAFDKPYTEITQLYEVSGGKYPVHVYINQPRNVTGLMLFSTQPSKVRDASGGYLYYTWYQVDYEYEIITFSEARWDDLLKVKSSTSDPVQWFNYYFWSALNTG